MATVFNIVEDDDSDPEKIAAQLSAQQAKIAELDRIQKASLKAAEPIDDEIAEIEREAAELEKKRAALRRKKWAATQDAQDAAHKKSLAQTGIKDLENKLRAATAEKHKQSIWDAKSKELDDLTRGAHWREHAFDHQIQGAKSAAVIGGRMILADKRGLGKSATSLITADMVKSQRLLIISKREILSNFEREVKKWAPHRTVFSIVSENQSFRDYMLTHMLPKMEEFTLLVNFEAWRKDKSVIKKLIALQADMVIIDEAHHMKEIDKLNFKGVNDILYVPNKCPICDFPEYDYKGSDMYECKKCGLESEIKEWRSVKNVLPMTGSPVLNRPEELFALLHSVDIDAFPDKNYFLKQYCEKRGYTTLTGGWAYKWDFRPGGAAQLMNMLGPQFLQRTRQTAGIHIPEQDVQIYELEMTDHKYQRQAYNDLVEFEGLLFDKEGKGTYTATAIVSLITRLRQATTWPNGITKKDDKGNVVWRCDVEESVKIDKAEELIKEFVGEGERVVVFSKFVDPLKELQRRLDETRSATQREDGRVRSTMYYGGTAYNLRDRIKTDFDASVCDKENYEWDTVLCQYDAAGEGLNFNHATQMIFLDEEWNPEKAGQAMGRIDRIGQLSSTTVHILRVLNSIDTAIAEMNLDKLGIIDGFEADADMVRKLLEKLRGLL